MKEQKKYQWDVAVSYSSGNEEQSQELATFLNSAEISYYDYKKDPGRTKGENFRTSLYEIYHKECQGIVAFFSEEYFSREDGATITEFEVIKDRFKGKNHGKQQDFFFLPVIIDEYDLSQQDKILSNLDAVWWSRINPGQSCQDIIDFIKHHQNQTPEKESPEQPNDQVEQTLIENQRPWWKRFTLKISFSITVVIGATLGAVWFFNQDHSFNPEVSLLNNCTQESFKPAEAIELYAKIGDHKFKVSRQGKQWLVKELPDSLMGKSCSFELLSENYELAKQNVVLTENQITALYLKPKGGCRVFYDIRFLHDEASQALGTGDQLRLRAVDGDLDTLLTMGGHSQLVFEWQEKENLYASLNSTHWNIVGDAIVKPGNNRLSLAKADIGIRQNIYMTGRVIHAVDETPIAGIRVTGGHGKSAVTDDNGTFRLVFDASFKNRQVQLDFTDPLGRFKASSHYYKVPKNNVKVSLKVLPQA